MASFISASSMVSRAFNPEIDVGVCAGGGSDLYRMSN